jgi:hypothetical protein
MMHFDHPQQLLDQQGVPADSRVRGNVSLRSASERGATVEAVYGLTVENEGNTRPACVAALVVLHT